MLGVACGLNVLHISQPEEPLLLDLQTGALAKRFRLKQWAKSQSHKFGEKLRSTSSLISTSGIGEVGY
jgi:hypothetical protein